MVSGTETLAADLVRPVSCGASMVGQIKKTNSFLDCGLTKYQLVININQKIHQQDNMSGWSQCVNILEAVKAVHYCWCCSPELTLIFTFPLTSI